MGEQRNLPQIDQSATRHYYEPVEPHQITHVHMLIAGAVLVIAAPFIVIGAISQRDHLSLIGSLLFYGVIALVAILLPAIFVSPLLHKGALDKIKREHAALDLQAKADQIRRENEIHTLMLEEAQLTADNAGNYPAVYRRRSGEVVVVQAGQYIQPVPHTYSPTFHYTNKDASTRIEEEGQEQLAAGSLSNPTMEQFYSIIPFNSLQVPLGLDVATQKLITAPIPKSTHIKIIGGSDMGKSCLAGAILQAAITLNDASHLQLGLLDLEHNTSRLFEDAPHIAEIGPKHQRLIGRNPDEVAQKLQLLQWELNRRSALGEEHCLKHEVILFVYIEEMLSLKYEVVDKALNKEMLAAINILGIRGRKYGIFFLICMQCDYSDKSTREAMAQYRTRGGFAIDPDTARAAGFVNTELIKENYLASRKGQYVLESPTVKSIVLAPHFDVRAMLLAQSATTNAPTGATINRIDRPYQSKALKPLEGATTDMVVDVVGAMEGAKTPSFTAQEKRILRKYREGIAVSTIIASEYTDGAGKPLTAGRLFTEKAREIQLLVARALPVEIGE